MTSFRPNQDLGQVIAVERRGKQRPFVDLEALERLAADDVSVLPKLLGVYRTIWDREVDRAHPVYVLRDE